MPHQPEPHIIGAIEARVPLAKEPMLGIVMRDGKPVNDYRRTGRKGGPQPGAGRPKGSQHVRNGRNAQLADYILSRHRNPVDAAAEIVDAPLTDLAEKLDCTKLEAADFWRKCAEFVARYTCRTMPAEVNVKIPLAGHLTVINLSPPKPGEEVTMSAYGVNMQVRGGQEDDDEANMIDVSPEAP